MKEYFNKKCNDLNLNQEEANSDFKNYLEKNPEYKITKANITKFLKAMSSEEENLEPEVEATGNFFLGYDSKGKPLYR